jgi:DNA-binding FrmR family transcriptional regulator
MTTHLTESQLNDYVDGALDQVAEAAADEHLAHCAPCASEVAALRRLLTTAADLPLSLEPPVHLWSNVRRESMEARSSWFDSVWDLRAPLAAAAVLLITIASGLTYWATRDAGTASTGSVASAPAPSALGLAQAEQDYLSAARTLIQLLEERRHSADPVVMQSVEDNLRAVDQAIRDAKQALATDSMNHAVSAILNATYQQKVQMLRRAVRLTGET